MLLSNQTLRVALLAQHLRPSSSRITSTAITASSATSQYRRNMSSQLKIIHTTEAPAAIGPYCKYIYIYYKH
jgi:hypothetical protein